MTEQESLPFKNCFYIEDQITGLIDGYYISEVLAETIACGLNLMTREHLFLVKNWSERGRKPIHGTEFLGTHEWFLKMVEESNASDWFEVDEEDWQ